jgi:hypothetical protein
MAAPSSLATLWRACQVVISPPSVRLARRMTVIAPISLSLSDMAVSAGALIEQICPQHQGFHMALLVATIIRQWLIIAPVGR